MGQTDDVYSAIMYSFEHYLLEQVYSGNYDCQITDPRNKARSYQNKNLLLFIHVININYINIITDLVFIIPCL